MEFRRVNCINRSEEIYNEFRRRGVKYLFHFTPVENLTSILKYGIIPYSAAARNGLNPVCTDSDRADGHIDCVSFSVSFPNYRMFYAKRQNMHNKFAVLKVDIEAIRNTAEADMLFFPVNAAKSGFGYTSPTGLENLSKMFNGICGRPYNLPSCYPADAQAEILIRGGIQSRFIREIDFEDVDLFLKFRSVGTNGQVKVNLSKDFFNSRDYYLINTVRGA